MEMGLMLCVLGLLIYPMYVVCWDGHDYYNDRYTDDGIAYTADDSLHGLWSSTNLYQHNPAGAEAWDGCSYDKDNANVTACSGPTLLLTNLAFVNITLGIIDTSVTSITITDCASFELFETGVFDTLTSLTYLEVQRTALNHMPDLSNTIVQAINLAGNSIVMNTATHRGWTMPSTITHIAMMDNQLHWIPNGMISGPNLRIASFSNNQLLQLQPTIFGDVSALIYLGMDGNQITRLSRNSKAPLATNTFLHLNISNNLLSFVQPKTFSQLPALKILEVHENSLATINWDIFSDIPNLVHLDLHANSLQTLTVQSFVNLPMLKEFRLHSQDPPMTSIAYNAWSNIGASLKYLFVSDNELSTYPHQILEEGYYPNLIYIYADRNSIVNMTEYGTEAFPTNQYSLYSQKYKTFTPFTAYPYLTHLYLQTNEITNVNTSDLCGLPNLVLLHLADNNIRESGMDNDCFACLSSLKYLYIGYNKIQYVPDSVKTSAGVPALTHLYLQYDKITFLETDAFSGVDTLTYLRLDYNNILAVENGAFPTQLTSLNISNNEFRFLHERPFSNMTSVTDLNINYNVIQYIPDSAFEDLTSLTNLHVTGNNIAQLLATHLQSCPLTGTVSFAENDIGWIEDGTFDHITTISSLDLSQNTLTTLPVGGDFSDLTVTGDLNLAFNRINILSTNVFTDLVIGGELYLSDNQISHIHAYAFSTVSCYNLNLGNNPLNKIYPYAFNSVSVGNALTLSSPTFTNIPAKAFHVVSADKIYLDTGSVATIESGAFYDVTVAYMYLNNNNLNTITQPLFGGTSTVTRELRLEDNSLTSITDDAFDSLTLRDIYLNNNLLTEYPQALKSQTPRFVNLDSNLMTQIRSGSFDGQTSLKHLYLSNNLLEYIEPGLFDDLVLLIRLNINNNNLKTLPDGLLNNSPDLKYLIIQANAMTHLHALNNAKLITVLAQQNDIKTIDASTFTASASSLTTLNLYNNPLECSCQLVATLDDVASAISLATCSQPSTASSITFSNSLTDDDSYYASDVNPTAMICSAANVVSSDITGVQFTLNWDQPSELYYVVNATSGASPTLVGDVTYSVLCTSTTGSASLTFTEATTAVNGTVTYEKIFTTADGVVAGTTYECSVALKTNDSKSALSEPSVFTTPDTAASPGTAGTGDIQLTVLYYDFSRSHNDFNDLNYPTVTAPTYVASPYGAWLSDSTTPTTDTFSTWFRNDHVGSTNTELESYIILEAQTGTIKKYWSDTYFPVDGLGYRAEFQQDCSGVYKNFGFTSAIRTGINFTGSETITVGGGDALWLYINKVKLVEFVSTGSASIPCYVVDLSPASTTGSMLYVQEGVLSSSGSCDSLVTSTVGISLDLEIGVNYHFDLFHVESKLCTSEFLLQVEDTVFSTDNTVDLPVDYTVSIDEDLAVGSILTDITLTDHFSQGGYTITLYAGNEGRRFSMEDSSYTFTAPIVTYTYTNFTDIYGNNVAYVECSTSTAVTMTTTTGSETFSFTSSLPFVTLIDELDYEAVTSYKLLLSVVDDGIPLTGYIAVRIVINDVNDNCPVLSPTSVDVTPTPVLRTASIATFTATDGDSGANQEIHYVVSAVTEDPAVVYDSSRDLWDDIYLGYNSLTFDVVAIDGGSVPRGMSASIHVNVSTTCVMDVLFGHVDYVFSVNDTTGEMVFRVPGYWMYEFWCNSNISLTKGTVLDTMMSSSSDLHSIETAAGRARVDNLENAYSNLAGAWVAGTTDTNQWVAVDMSMPYQFTSVYIQGRSDADEWVTSFKIQYYDDATSSWLDYTHSDGTLIFTGNTDRTTVVGYGLDPYIFSNKIRVNPQAWSGSIAMRLEFSGCAQSEQLFYDVSCMRCETTYYCEGDGVQHYCGRCADSSATCDRNAVEHSFGLAAACTTCPDGWICKDGYATPCDAYHYVECTNTSCPVTCSPCEAGYACLDGRRTICRPGTYADALSANCTSCEIDTYQDEYGQSLCKSCISGHFSPVGMWQCDQCAPELYPSDGTCVACTDSTECPCLTGTNCFDISICYNTGSGGFLCNNCTAGYTGDGTMCDDIDECTLYDPCFNSRCINTSPGYQCLECPEGYSGTFEDAYAWDVHQRVFIFQNLERSNFSIQTCNDIDECATNHGGCDSLMPCVNTVSSYYCDFCSTGYMGTNRTGCYLDNFCLSGTHDCNAGADCVYLGPAQYRCVCSPGYAGNGEVCGVDSDNDGFPDTGVSCTDWGCTRDNCRSVSNSMQEDTDHDNKGNNCDTDDDNDGRYDYLDNCQFSSNWNQSDIDGDGYGDVCDTCPSLANTDQLDTDLDGVGNDCDNDDDDDGIDDSTDNCPLVSNPLQENSDGDSHGDACDNCPTVNNEDQADTNQNNYGDVCDTPGGTNIDEDGDGVVDTYDNCPSYMNGDQSDIDGDGTGDLCDDDIDDDGVLNTADNCPYYSNSDQSDDDGNDVGDICETDSDADGVSNKNDTCPYNAGITKTSFTSYFTVDLDPAITTTGPEWLVKNNGGEVMQTTSTEMPTMLIGTQQYGAIEYKGTWFVSDTTASDYVGCVFGYVSNTKFYVIMWRGQHYNYKDDTESTYKGGIKGAQIKLVDFTTGPSSTLAEALWHSYDTTNHVTMLWQDPDMNGWEPELSYRWYLTHKPSTGYINLKIYRAAALLVDSGDVYDASISGGRVGVFQFGSFPVTWSYLQVDCLEHTNQGLYLDGVDDYITLDDIRTLNMENSFTVEVWLSLDTGYTAGPYPIFCSADGDVCLWIEGAVVNGRYKDKTVTSTTTLNADQWYNVIFRHSIETQTISIFMDGVQDGSTSDVAVYNWTETATTSNLTIYIGRENTTYFRGTIDELRLYSEALLDAEITSHISLPALDRPIKKAYATLHFRMEDSVTTTTTSSITNSGLLTSPTASLNGGAFVQSYEQYHQFNIAHPDN